MYVSVCMFIYIYNVYIYNMCVRVCVYVCKLVSMNV